MTRKFFSSHSASTSPKSNSCGTLKMLGPVGALSAGGAGHFCCARASAVEKIAAIERIAMGRIFIRAALHISQREQLRKHLVTRRLCVPLQARLSQLGVFGFGGYQDGDSRVGVFPQGEEILVGYAGFGWVTFDVVGAGQAQLC